MDALPSDDPAPVVPHEDGPADHNRDGVLVSAREVTDDLMVRLRRHYIPPGPLPGGVFIPECGWNGAGLDGGRRRCDALYIGFTSKSGRRLIGHEVKATKADWRNEHDKVGKADEWADQCHEWWIVAPREP